MRINDYKFVGILSFSSARNVTSHMIFVATILSVSVDFLFVC
uniref:Uncharacterized protein n=1 Tax=Arundo donax TaxID=35708 RepID=A0A0A9AYT7_ARUDO